MREAIERHKYSTGNQELDQEAESLISRCSGQSDHDALVRDMILTALKMKQEDNSLLELKIATSALKEMRYSFKVFREYQHRKKATVFGSARAKRGSDVYDLAREFSRTMALHAWMIISGAGGGIMEAANEGAGKENSFGLNIRLPFEQKANPFILDDEKLIIYKYFFTRKLMFVKEGDAFAFFPGGFGTLNEGLEVLTLIQTGKTSPSPVVMLDVPGGTFWKGFNDYLKESLLAHSYISPADLDYAFITDSIDEACEHILHFYRNYHSLRHVRDRAVIRLNMTPGEGFIEAVNRQFSDIGGPFSIEGHLHEEAGETAIHHLPRLVFPFDGRSYGRLRKLIDFINDAVGEPVPCAAGFEPSPHIE